MTSTTDSVHVPVNHDWRTTLSTRERTVRVIGAIPSTLRKPAPFLGEPDDQVELSWDEQAEGPEPGTLYIKDIASGLVLLYRGDSATVVG